MADPLTDLLFDIVWTDLVNTQVSGDELINTGTNNNWKNGAASANILFPGKNGYILYKVSETNFNSVNRVLGLSETNANAGNGSIEYAFFFKKNKVRLIESGTDLGIEKTYTTGDKFYIKRVDNKIIYVKNAEILYETNTNSQKQLIADVSLKEQSASFKGVKASFPVPIQATYTITEGTNPMVCSVTLGVTGGFPPYYYQWSTGQTTSVLTDVMPDIYTVTVSDYFGNPTIVEVNAFILSDIEWTDLVNTQVQDNKLIKTAGLTNKWDAGAASSCILGSAQNGMIRYTVSEANFSSTERMLGFSRQNVDAGKTIDYALFFSNNKVKICELGTVLPDVIKTYSIGDIFQVVKNNDKIIYKMNGTVLREAAFTPAAPLIADVTIKDTSAYFEAVQASFCISCNTTAVISDNGDGCNPGSAELSITVASGTFSRWQQSLDKVNFTDLPGGTTNPYTLYINTTTWFRAVIGYENNLLCYSNVVKYSTGNSYYINDSSLADDLWTTTAGDDNNDGLTPATPKATLEVLFDAYEISNCATIYIDAGTYTETPVIKECIITAADKYLEITGAGNDVTLFNAMGQNFNFRLKETGYIQLKDIGMTGAAGSNVQLLNSHHITIAGCKIQDSNNAGIVCAGISALPSEYNELTNNVITNAAIDGRGIIVRGKCTNLTITGNSLNATGAGAALHKSL
ncbi:MAG: right-handed parallel beta-helix repeat-containing protein [Bacteroidia bacterium]|nr:right-handed parallel beta-helix repeat-containing protein [Bacteroidia bacterium]